MIHRVLGARFGWRWRVWCWITREGVVRWCQPYRQADGVWASTSAHSALGGYVKGESPDAVVKEISFHCGLNGVIGVLHQSHEVVYPIRKSDRAYWVGLPIEKGGGS